MGHAGFHSAALYEDLRATIGPLVALLRDDEDKTRANAAGALGNLVRNSGLLCQSLIQAGALQVNLWTSPAKDARCVAFSRGCRSALLHLPLKRLCRSRHVRASCGPMLRVAPIPARLSTSMVGARHRGPAR